MGAKSFRQWFAFLMISLCSYHPAVAEHLQIDSESELSFDERLEILRATKVSRASIPQLVTAYEQLIADFPSNSGITVVLYELAVLNENNRDQTAAPVGNSLQRAIDLFRQVTEKTTPGSPLNIDASLELAACLREVKRDGALAEARTIIESLLQRYLDRFAIATRSKAELVQQYIAERKFKAADKLCRDLLQFDSGLEGKRLSKSDQSILRVCQLRSAVGVMQAMIYRRGTKAEKEEWFRDFANTASKLPHLAKDIELNKKQLSTIESVLPDTRTLVAETSSGRKLFLFLNIFAFVVLAALVARHRLIRRLQSVA
jgi:hypothetical protein